MAPRRKSGANTAGRDADGRFAAGNPGKPKGARHKATLAVEALIEGEAEALARRAILAAMGGDVAALRLCLDRIAPARKDRPVEVELPAVNGVEDHPAALAAIVAAAASGELSAGEATAFAAVLAEHRKALEVADLAERIAALEKRVKA